MRRFSFFYTILASIISKLANLIILMSLSVTYSDTKDDLKLADSDEGLIGYSLTTIPSIPIYIYNVTAATPARDRKVRQYPYEPFVNLRLIFYHTFHHGFTVQLSLHFFSTPLLLEVERKRNLNTIIFQQKFAIIT